MYVCICNGVTDSQILQAVEEGANTVRELNKTLSVGNCCGKCTRVARDLIKSHFDRDEIDSLSYSAV
jgi:bacterioferritin-associated ferredoxin